MDHKKILFLFLFLIINLSLVSGQPPFQTESLDFDEGLVIFVPNQYHFVANQDHTFNFQVFNKSDGIAFTNASANCSFMLIDDQGNFDYLLSHAGYSNGAFKVTLTAGNFTDGHYNYGIKCITLLGEIGGMRPTDILVTEDGLEITEGRSILIIGLLSILVLLLFISLFALFKIEHYIGKFTMYWISHILMVLICFVGWQIGVEGLLGGMALTGIFRIMFWVFTLAVIPMVFLSMAWVFYIHTYNEHFQRLVEKGEDTATAFAMTNKKYRRKPSW